ncbi:hypothetical protein M513_10108 [Trichuris suis]|uniref:Uncharacterized protein n=1 Tax=Trichuris suis TaxID=68888 RepID=A0A085LVR4_9BILA|nr:hypothetical protein M513_10108 [Trichuris suis]
MEIFHWHHVNPLKGQQSNGGILTDSGDHQHIYETMFLRSRHKLTLVEGWGTGVVSLTADNRHCSITVLEHTLYCNYAMRSSDCRVKEDLCGKGRLVRVSSLVIT